MNSPLDTPQLLARYSLDRYAKSFRVVGLSKWR
jgi:hypothetical protein